MVDMSVIVATGMSVRIVASKMQKVEIYEIKINKSQKAEIYESEINKPP